MKFITTNIRSVITQAIAIYCCAFQHVNAANFLVTNTNDAGAGSLRQALLGAKTNSGADEIDATGITGTYNTTSQLECL